MNRFGTVLALWLLAGGSAFAAELTVRGQPLSLDPENLQDREVDRLRYRAGFHLTGDLPEFGGFSGMTLSDHRLVAVSDRGYWLTLELRHAADGTLEGFGRAEMGPLLDLDGRPVEGRERYDAEELVELPGRFLVTFEGHHRIFDYAAEGDPPAPRGRPGVISAPAGLSAADDNMGMEAVTPLDDDQLLVLTEDLRDPRGDIVGWIGCEAGWEALSLVPFDTFVPTSAATFPDGDVLLLERSYSEETKITRVRFSRIAARSIVAGARLAGDELALLSPPRTVDNMEAVAIREVDDDTLLIYVLSDDNFSVHQRTLLMEFELSRP